MIRGVYALRAKGPGLRDPGSTRTARPPRTTGVHHFSPTVSDVEASARWYARVFSLERLARIPPHHAGGSPGYAVLLTDPVTGLLIGLHHHEQAAPGPADERRPGLDHLAWRVESREELESWAAWLDSLDVPHSGVIETETYDAIVFRDPDNIQLELIHPHLS